MIVKTPADKLELIRRITILPLDKGAWEVSAARFKRNRSLAQNRLVHMWYKQIADGTKEMIKEQVENTCKWRFGCPILARDDKDFAEFYDRMLNNYTYEESVASMPHVSVTSDMGVKQMTEYMDHVAAYAEECCVALTHPEDLYQEAYG